MQQLARRLNRTPGSVAMKLCNFASLDPALRIRGIKGLEGASRLDRSLWDEFHRDPEEAVPASEEAFRDLFEVDDDEETEVIPSEGIRMRKRRPSRPTEVTAEVKQRRGQGFFRDAIINNFGGRCGVTGLGVRELLVASHILPWSQYPAHRLNVRNGLCLSRLHDAAFDNGLIAFDGELRLLLANEIREVLSQRIVKENFGEYAGEPLKLPPDAAGPDPGFLAMHREKIFRG